MKHLYPIFENLAVGSTFVMFLAFLIAVNRFRLINSTVICSGLALLMYSLMNIMREPLLLLESREAWYGTWTMMCGLSVYLLYKSHDVLKVNLAKVTNRVAFVFCISACVHTARYIDRQHFGGQYLETFYPLAINTINISLAIIILVTVLKDKKEKLVGLYV